MSDKNTSSLQAAIDSASGAVQGALGAITGSRADQQAGENKKEKAHLEDEASHAAAKVGPYSASSDGAITKDDPNRSEGSWNQTIGSGKEFIGGAVGNEKLRQEGRDQNLQGQGQEAQGQLNDLGSGMANRAAGTLHGVVAGITGDRDAQAEAQKLHDDGKSRQRGAEVDIQKQNA